MHPALNHNLFFIKEHTGMFKASNSYDVLDPNSGQSLMECREENLGWFVKFLRFGKYKRMTPFDLLIRDPQGSPVLRVKRGVAIFLSTVEVLDGSEVVIGRFKQKMFSLGGAFTVLDASDQPICELKGKWTSWEFSFRSGETELAKVTKKWAGIGKELFTSADNYILQISEQVPPDDPIRQLIFGAVMCIDLVLKE